MYFEGYKEGVYPAEANLARKPSPIDSEHASTEHSAPRSFHSLAVVALDHRLPLSFSQSCSDKTIIIEGECVTMLETIMVYDYTCCAPVLCRGAFYA